MLSSMPRTLMYSSSRQNIPDLYFEFDTSFSTSYLNSQLCSNSASKPRFQFTTQIRPRYGYEALFPILRPNRIRIRSRKGSQDSRRESKFLLMLQIFTCRSLNPTQTRHSHGHDILRPFDILPNFPLIIGLKSKLGLAKSYPLHSGI